MAWLRARAALIAWDSLGSAAADAIATRCAAAMAREGLPWALAAAAAVRAGLARARGADPATLRAALGAAAEAAFGVDMKLLGWAAQWQRAAWCGDAHGPHLGDQRIAAPARMVRTWLPG